MEKRDITIDLRDKLFTVIRAGMNLEMPHLELSVPDCERIVKIGSHQSITPIIIKGLKNLKAPESIIKDGDKDRLKDTKQFIIQNDALMKISAVLDKEAIPYLPLKGAVLRRLYPSPELRTSSDIDVLVMEDDLDRAVASIENTTDFRTRKHNFHDVSMVNPNIHLELHFSIQENMENIDRLLKRVWEYTEPDQGSRYKLTPEFQVFHVIAHMSYHFLHGGLGIRPFIDLWLLKNRTTYNEEKVRAMCSECSILNFYEECCKLSKVWLESVEHTETTAVFEEFCLSGGVFGSAQFKSAGRQRNYRGWKYIFSRAFPPVQQVKKYYEDSSGKMHSKAYYYAKRISSWVSKERRSELKKRISAIVSSDQEYLDLADELFDRLGL